MLARRPDLPVSPSAPSLSRRSALARLGAGGLAMMLASRATGAAAVEHALDDNPATVVLHRWLDAWNSPAPASAVAALYAPDGTYEDAPAGARCQPGGVEAFLAAFAGQASELALVSRGAVRAGHLAVAEWDLAFRYTGHLPGLPPGQGQRVALRGATFFELVDGTPAGDRIRRSCDYYDGGALLRQVGVVPAAVAARVPGV
ncbi:MAG: nuclear transport factor 2 family protein [Chloroflexota bacterium]|nr:nuclear transport factor 2 family protein [Chloroflexota bacterium]